MNDRGRVLLDYQVPDFIIKNQVEMIERELAFGVHESITDILESDEQAKSKRQ